MLSRNAVSGSFCVAKLTIIVNTLDRLNKKLVKEEAYQSVNGEHGFRVVENVAQSTGFAVDKFETERLLEATVKGLLAIDSYRIGRLIGHSAIGRSRWSTCRNNVKKTRFTLVAHCVARPARHDAKVQFRLRRIVQDAAQWRR